MTGLVVACGLTGAVVPGAGRLPASLAGLTGAVDARPMLFPAVVAVALPAVVAVVFRAAVAVMAVIAVVAAVAVLFPAAVAVMAVIVVVAGVFPAVVAVVAVLFPAAVAVVLPVLMPVFSFQAGAPGDVRKAGGDVLAACPMSW